MTTGPGRRGRAFSPTPGRHPPRVSPWRSPTSTCCRSRTRRRSSLAASACPDGSMSWSGAALRDGPGAARAGPRRGGPPHRRRARRGVVAPPAHRGAAPDPRHRHRDRDGRGALLPVRAGGGRRRARPAGARGQRGLRVPLRPRVPGPRRRPERPGDPCRGRTPPRQRRHHRARGDRHRVRDIALLRLAQVVP